MDCRFKDLVPVFPPDDRQIHFFKAMREGKADDDFNVTYGYYAAYVSLSWLQDTIRALWRCGELLSGRDVSEFVTTAVQRVVSVDVEVNEDDIDVDLMTEDDYGYYQFTFQVTDLSPDRKD